MRCPACLAEVIGSGKFCASCGTRITQAADAPVPAEPAASSPVSPQAAVFAPPPEEHLETNDIAFSQTEAPPPVDPFASTANPSDGEFRAAAIAAAAAAHGDGSKVSPLASSSFDLGSEQPPISRGGPLPAAGNPPVSLPGSAMGSPASVAPRSKHGSTVLLSAMPNRSGPKPTPAGPSAGGPPPSIAKPAVPHAPAPQAGPASIGAAHAGGPPSGYMQGPASRHMPPSSIAAHPPAALPPGTRVIVNFPNGQRVFGTIWQCAQAHYLVQFPDGKSQWIETALVRSV